MKEHSRKLLDKAIDSIEAAELLTDKDKSDMAVGRAYYAMFYIAEALLNEKGLKFNKHSAVHAALGNVQSFDISAEASKYCGYRFNAYVIAQDNHGDWGAWSSPLDFSIDFPIPG